MTAATKKLTVQPPAPTQVDRRASKRFQRPSEADAKRWDAPYRTLANVLAELSVTGSRAIVLANRMLAYKAAVVVVLSDGSRYLQFNPDRITSLHDPEISRLAASLTLTTIKDNATGQTYQFVLKAIKE